MKEKKEFELITDMFSEGLRKKLPIGLFKLHSKTTFLQGEENATVNVNLYNSSAIQSGFFYKNIATNL